MRMMSVSKEHDDEGKQQWLSKRRLGGKKLKNEVNRAIVKL